MIWQVEVPIQTILPNILQNQQIAAQNLRIQEINTAIDELARNINEHPHLNLGVEQFKGYVAEEFVSGTFNIDALKKVPSIWRLHCRIMVTGVLI